MSLLKLIALASTGMVEIKRNQAGFILYIQGRANPPKLERFVTFWSFPRWSNILQLLTGGCRNRLTICQIRYKETNSETVTLSTLGGFLGPLKSDLGLFWPFRAIYSRYMIFTKSSYKV